MEEQPAAGGFLTGVDDVVQPYTLPRNLHEIVEHAGKAAERASAASSRPQSERDEDEESDYGEVLDGTGTMMDARMLDREEEARLERELDGFGSEEEYLQNSDGEASDSSIDVQTPLP